MLNITANYLWSQLLPLVHATAFLPLKICPFRDSPSTPNNHSLVVLDRFLKSMITLTIHCQVLTHCIVPSSIPSQIVLVFLMTEHDFAPSKITSGMQHALCVDIEQ